MVVVARVTQIGQWAGLGVGGVGAFDAVLVQLIHIGPTPADAEEERHQEANYDGEQSENDQNENEVYGGEVTITDRRPFREEVTAGLLIAEQWLGKFAVDEVLIDHLIKDADGAICRVTAVGACLSLQSGLDPPKTAAHQLVIMII